MGVSEGVTGRGRHGRGKDDGGAMFNPHEEAHARGTELSSRSAPDAPDPEGLEPGWPAGSDASGKGEWVLG